MGVEAALGAGRAWDASVTLIALSEDHSFPNQSPTNTADVSVSLGPPRAAHRVLQVSLEC